MSAAKLRDYSLDWHGAREHRRRAGPAVEGSLDLDASLELLEDQFRPLLPDSPNA